MFNLFSNKKYTKEEEEILNIGLDLAIKNYAKSIRTQLREKYPSLTGRELNEYDNLCQKVAKFGTNEVHKLVNKKGTSLKVEDLKPKLASKYKWVNDENVSRLINWGVYVSQR